MSLSSSAVHKMLLDMGKDIQHGDANASTSESLDPSIFFKQRLVKEIEQDLCLEETDYQSSEPFSSARGHDTDGSRSRSVSIESSSPPQSKIIEEKTAPQEDIYTSLLEQVEDIKRMLSATLDQAKAARKASSSKPREKHRSRRKRKRRRSTSSHDSNHEQHTDASNTKLKSHNEPRHPSVEKLLKYIQYRANKAVRARSSSRSPARQHAPPRTDNGPMKNRSNFKNSKSRKRRKRRSNAGEDYYQVARDSYNRRSSERLDEDDSSLSLKGKELYVTLGSKLRKMSMIFNKLQAEGMDRVIPIDEYLRDTIKSYFNRIHAVLHNVKDHTMESLWYTCNEEFVIVTTRWVRRQKPDYTQLLTTLSTAIRHTEQMKKLYSEKDRFDQSLKELNIEKSPHGLNSDISKHLQERLNTVTRNIAQLENKAQHASTNPSPSEPSPYSSTASEKGTRHPPTSHTVTKNDDVAHGEVQVVASSSAYHSNTVLVSDETFCETRDSAPDDAQQSKNKGMSNVPFLEHPSGLRGWSQKNYDEAEYNSRPKVRVQPLPKRVKLILDENVQNSVSVLYDTLDSLETLVELGGRQKDMILYATLQSEILHHLRMWWSTPWDVDPGDEDVSLIQLILMYYDCIAKLGPLLSKPNNYMFQQLVQVHEKRLVCCNDILRTLQKWNPSLNLTPFIPNIEANTGRLLRGSKLILKNKPSILTAATKSKELWTYFQAARTEFESILSEMSRHALQRLDGLYLSIHSDPNSNDQPELSWSLKGYQSVTFAKVASLQKLDENLLLYAVDGIRNPYRPTSTYDTPKIEELVKCLWMLNSIQERRSVLSWRLQMDSLLQQVTMENQAYCYIHKLTLTPKVISQYPSLNVGDLLRLVIECQEKLRPLLRYGNSPAIMEMSARFQDRLSWAVKIIHGEHQTAWQNLPVEERDLFTSCMENVRSSTILYEDVLSKQLANGNVSNPGSEELERYVAVIISNHAKLNVCVSNLIKQSETASSANAGKPVAFVPPLMSISVNGPFW